MIPAYNASGTIHDCLESVLSEQDCTDFEIIVVDDGSLDSTASIVEREFPSVRLLRKKNGGPGSARNLGVEQAEGDVVVFIDADDKMLPGRMVFQGQYMLDHPHVGLCFGNQVLEKEPSRNVVNEVGFVTTDEFTIIDNALSKLITHGNFVPNTASAVRRKAYLDDGRQPTNILVCEDYAMNCGIALNWAIAGSTRDLTWYRSGTGANLMSSKHTYYGPVVVLGEQLLCHKALLSETEYKIGFSRWKRLANNLLRYDWIEGGKHCVLRRIQELEPLIPVSLATKWRILSNIPTSIGYLLRWAKRIVLN